MNQVIEDIVENAMCLQKISTLPPLFVDRDRIFVSTKVFMLSDLSAASGTMMPV